MCSDTTPVIVKGYILSYYDAKYESPLDAYLDCRLGIGAEVDYFRVPYKMVKDIHDNTIFVANRKGGLVLCTSVSIVDEQNFDIPDNHWIVAEWNNLVDCSIQINNETQNIVKSARGSFDSAMSALSNERFDEKGIKRAVNYASYAINQLKRILQSMEENS